MNTASSSNTADNAVRVQSRIRLVVGKWAGVCSQEVPFVVRFEMELMKTPIAGERVYVDGGIFFVDTPILLPYAPDAIQAECWGHWEVKVPATRSPCMVLRAMLDVYDQASIMVLTALWASDAEHSTQGREFQYSQELTNALQDIRQALACAHARPDQDAHAMLGPEWLRDDYHARRTGKRRLYAPARSSKSER